MISTGGLLQMNTKIKLNPNLFMERLETYFPESIIRAAQYITYSFLLQPAQGALMRQKRSQNHLHPCEPAVRTVTVMYTVMLHVSRETV